MARRVVVRGHVQGVWFRESCRSRAEAVGVAGWVRNRDDGAVEAWLEGDMTDVETVIGWCRRGPRRAVVTNVRVEPGRPEGHSSFVVQW